MSTNRDWGVQYELDATSITTSYQAVSPVTANAVYAARVPRRRYSLVASLINTTNITGIKAKLSASPDGVTYTDIASTDDATGTLQIEQTYSTIVSHKISGSFFIDGGFNYLQVSLKSVGGAGQALETLKVSQLDVTVVDTGVVATLLGAQTLSNKTLSAPVISGGLTASGSASNDFSGSTGAFKTSSGTNTLGGTAAFTAGLTASGSTALDFSGSTGAFKTSTGTNTLGGKVAFGASTQSITDPGNAGAISVATDGVCNLTSAGVETRTLAIPTFVGQDLTLCFDTRVGNIAVTVASAFDTSAHTTITLTAAGQYVVLKGCTIAGVRAWRLVTNGGATLS